MVDAKLEQLISEAQERYQTYLEFETLVDLFCEAHHTKYAPPILVLVWAHWMVGLISREEAHKHDIRQTLLKLEFDVYSGSAEAYYENWIKALASGGF